MTIAANDLHPGEPVRAVVCDLDGTLIDTERIFAEAARLVLARRGIALEPDFMATMQGTPGRDALPRFRSQYKLADTVEQLAAEYKASFYEVLGNQPVPLMAGALDLLNLLRTRSLPTAIATSSSREYVETVFAPHGLHDRFEFILTIDDVTHGKPHPEIFELAARRLGVHPRQMVVLEDSTAGVQAARAAGARCVWVTAVTTPGDWHGVETVPSLDDPRLRKLLQS